MELNILATPKFFKRKMPELRQMELATRQCISNDTARLFIREVDDSNNPSRACAQLSASQCELLAAELLSLAKALRERNPSA